ncbi:MAG: pyruvate dehydrogenase complex dihydrolipoamide acetyltransferase [Pseudomonadota bacterium]
MPIPVLMPALSPTMEEGTLAKWLKSEGDEVTSGDIIAEIETDKATMEVEAIDEGKLGKILIAEGTEGVKVNAPIAVILEDGESAADIDEGSLGAAPTPAPAAAPEPAPAAAAPAAAPSPAPAAPAATPATAAATNGDARVKASPLAKRLAKQEGLPLDAIKGTGPHGRVVKRDVEKAMKEGVSAPAVAPSAPAPMPIAGVDPRLYPADTYTAIKNDGMRKVIAKRLHQSFNSEVPHFPLNIDLELTNLLEARARINAAAPPKGEEGHYKLSVNDFVVKACAQALKAVPAANASYTDEAILQHHHADIGVAVAIDGGLITPIVWQAETKGLQTISAEVKDLAGRARNKKLKPEEYQGGTFAISNLGMFGIKSFASIVNQPHGAILSVGTGEERVVVRNGEMVIRNMMTVTLTCDHRVVDGAVGAEFLAKLKTFIEDPATMLL